MPLDSLPVFNSKKDYNTVEFERGSAAFEDPMKFCDRRISSEELDSSWENFFSEENKKEAWGENYQPDNTIQVVQADGVTMHVSKLPTVWMGGMGTGISGTDAIEAMNKLGFGGHLSAVGGGWNYEEPYMYKEDGGKINAKVHKDQVEKEFYDVFEGKLGLSREQIDKHFLFPEEEGGKFKVQENNIYERLLRMKDLTGLYNNIIHLKKSQNHVLLNSMYKIGGYIATCKLATLAGIDAITTAAGFPEKKALPLMLREFLNDINRSEINMPACGVIASISMAVPEGYDYYIVEDGRESGGHQGLKASFIKPGASKIDPINVLNAIRKKCGDDVPVYKAGGVGNKKEVKKAFDEGFNGVQLGTQIAVTKEALNNKPYGDRMKKAMITGNHLGEKTKEDYEHEAEIRKLPLLLDRFISKIQYNTLKIINKGLFLDVDDKKLQEKLSFVMQYIEAEVFPDFTEHGYILRAELDEGELDLYNQIKAYFYHDATEFLKKEKTSEYLKKERARIREEGGVPNNADIKINEEAITPSEKEIDDTMKNQFRSYGNLLKMRDRFKKAMKDGGYPIMELGDSTARYPMRRRTDKLSIKLLALGLKTRGCVGCLTDCEHMERGGSDPSKGLDFCIIDLLDQMSVTIRKAMNFSGRTTVPYPKIQPLMDTMAFLMGTYVDRYDHPL